MKLSHSSISTYSDCPKKYEFKYVQRLPEKPKHFFSFGKSVHSALEFMYAGEVCPELDDILEAMEHEWVSEGYADIKAEDKAKRNAENMVRDYYRKHAAAWVKPLAVEAKFDMTVDHVRLTGYIDRVDVGSAGGLHVIDYKTGQSLDVARINEDEQMTMYQMAAESMYPESIVDAVSLYHVPTLTLHSAERRGIDLVEALRSKITRTADAIAGKEFKETPSEKSCSWCDFKPMCPAWRTNG